MVRMIPHRLKSNTASQSNSRSASPMRSPNPTLVLRTTAIKGRNLAAKDKSGTSDPYLVVSLGETKQSTPPVNKTLNPEWQVTFDLPVLGPQCALVHVFCWDKDRFGKDYMGEFDIFVDEIFANSSSTQEPKWYSLKSKRKDKKGSLVSGDILLQFALVDTANADAQGTELLQKLHSIISLSPEEEKQEELEMAAAVQSEQSGERNLDGSDDEDHDDEMSDEMEDPSKPETPEKRRRRLRLRRLKRKTKQKAYEFFGESDVVGIIFLEIGRVTDLPPERNVTRTGFDMDPFVIASFGRRTYRTRVIRHNLNPVFDEKLIFQVMRHEQQYSIQFSIVDRDKLSGNDFVARASFDLRTLIEAAPEADAETGLYKLRELSEPSTPVQQSKPRFRLPISRSSSASSLKNIARPSLIRGNSQASINNGSSQAEAGLAPTSVPDPNALTPIPSITQPEQGNDDKDRDPNDDDPDLRKYVIPLDLKNKEKWSERNPSQLYIRAKYMPYPALRQQFWRAMLKQYDADESGKISKVELTTMLDTLGSTLKEKTIDGFYESFGLKDPGSAELSYDQAVRCLENQLQVQKRKGSANLVGLSRTTTSDSLTLTATTTAASIASTQVVAVSDVPPATKDERTVPENEDPTSTAVPAIQVPAKGENEIDTQDVDADGLVDDRDIEHMIEIRECPICHQPRLNKRSDADIITHIATCASQDWKQVNNLVMAGFVTSSQAQRKWYSKVVTKIGYGGYRLGANSANILVQDRITGQINEERMSVYVRLGIRLLYKGLGARDMETKRIRKLLRSLSFKQGRKFDDPASASQIQGFINFHQLDMSEVMLSLDQFKNFNQFFYRALKPDARPCSAPDNPKIVVSPADCRSVVFNTIDDATRIWIKGREFSVERLLGNTYPQDAKRYKNGSLGIFRLAPQDYHRFHVPVDGTVDTPKLIEGEYYTVNPMAIRSALDVYGENIRTIVPIDSVAHGRVMVVCVGAMMVGSTVITRKPGEKVKRAEELGYFKFGGSTVVLLFEPGAMQFDSDLVDNSNGALETLIRVGTSIGHHLDTPQHTPDMRKKPENVTNEERQEAKRRIGGSLAPAPEELADIK